MPTVARMHHKKYSMNNSKLKEITVEHTTRLYPTVSHIDNDIAIIEDITTVPFPKEPRRVKSLCLGLCTQGTAEYTLDTVKYSVYPGDIVIINTNQVTDGFHQSSDAKGIGIQISDSFYYEIFSSIHELSTLFMFSRTHPVLHLEPAEAERIITYFNLIKSKVAMGEHHFRREAVRTLMQALIYEAAEAMRHILENDQPRSSRAESIYLKFIQMVEHHFRQERRVGWYAQQLGITPKYLAETIKMVSRRTPNEWIDDYVILEIRVILKNTSKNIKEIAKQMNFPNQSFFGKYFREHVGMSPSQFRKG